MASSLPMTNDREINPMELSLDQLNGMRTQHEEDIAELTRQLEALYGAKSRFNTARQTLDDLNQATENSTILIPLNQSLYVPGKIIDPSKVIVELGTGYFCDKPVPDAKDLIDRKVQLINKSIDTIESVGVNKKKNLEQITLLMNYKVQQSQNQA